METMKEIKRYASKLKKSTIQLRRISKGKRENGGKVILKEIMNEKFSRWKKYEFQIWKTISKQDK